MFRVLEVPEQGPPICVHGVERVAPPPPGVVRWVDLCHPEADELELLRRRFDFHPLAIEDCAHLDQRPKVEEFSNCHFLVTQSFRCGAEDVHELELLELHSFLGDRFLVTVHAGDIEVVEAALKRFGQEDGLPLRSADFIYHSVLDGMVDANFPILDRLAEALEAVEDEVVEGRSGDSLQRIFQLKRTVVTLRRVLSPQREVLGFLARPGTRFIQERSSFFFRDIYDHHVRIYESIDTARDLLGNALDAHLSMVSNRTNEIMKRLTLLSAIFLPLAFLTGFFGQNFTHLPFESTALLLAMLGACVLLPVSMLVWFKRSGWF